MHNFKSIKMNTNLKMLAALAAITLTSSATTLYATESSSAAVSQQAAMTVRGNVRM